ncbi:MAG: CBS domain-containing protein [Bacteroidales bacterium]|nr:CBS domain-containing protein [Bacteroidales bacterium]
MIASELISDIVVPLKTSDSVEVAISMMEEFKVSHIAVVNNRSYLALVSESDLTGSIDPATPVGNIKLALPHMMINGHQHIYDVIRMMSEHELTLLPVVDEDENYLGAISLESLTRNMAKMAAINQPGVIIVLEMSQNDYSLSEIAQIIESNDAKILSMYVTAKIDSTNLEVILKINKQDITQIMSTFNRYNYIIKASYGEDEDPGDLKDRFDSLMNYLNV